MTKAGYRCVYEGGVGEIIEKKSRFIATVCPVETEEEAIQFFNKVKKENWNATHNCTAFTIGFNHELTRCSDDGEPSGTAGRPMLDVLLREDIHNVAVVVTRYFGGTLLGTGGLVRAYQKSVQEGLAQAVVITKQSGMSLDIYTDYNGLGKLQYILAQRGITITDTEYTSDVIIHTMVPSEALEELKNAITEATGAKARMDEGDEVSYAMVKDELMIFDK